MAVFVVRLLAGEITNFFELAEQPADRVFAHAHIGREALDRVLPPLRQSDHNGKQPARIQRQALVLNGGFVKHGEALLASGFDDPFAHVCTPVLMGLSVTLSQQAIRRSHKPT